MRADWDRPIIFEGTELPGTAIGIDHLGMYDNLPEMSEATSDWLWRFTICVGRRRTCDSHTIVKHACETLELLERFRGRLLVSVSRRYDESFAPGVIDEWEDALRTIIKIAASRTTCTWESPLRPGEPNYGRPWPEVAAEMANNLEKVIARVKKRNREP